MQEFLLGQPKAPWTDLLRVDILNIIGLSIVLLGALFGAVSWLASMGAPSFPDPRDQKQDKSAGKAQSFPARMRARLAVAATLVACGIVLATPPLWTTRRPRWLPWFLESYINGVHIYDQPQSWLFPLFPLVGICASPQVWRSAACCFLLLGAPPRKWLPTGWTAASGAAALRPRLLGWTRARKVSMTPRTTSGTPVRNSS